MGPIPGRPLLRLSCSGRRKLASLAELNNATKLTKHFQDTARCTKHERAVGDLKHQCGDVAIRFSKQQQSNETFLHALGLPAKRKIMGLFSSTIALCSSPGPLWR
jgi:hypothetical protein